MDNPFLQRQLPSAVPWDHEKQRFWQEVRSLGRWRYALRHLGMRFTGSGFVYVLIVLLGFMLFPVVLRLVQNGPTAFDPRDLLLTLAVALWFPPLILALFALVGFVEGWMRWGFYEDIAALHAGPPYELATLVSRGKGMVALLNSRISGHVPGRVVRFDGQAWRTHYVNDSEDPLIDLFVCPDDRMLVTRVGGDLLTIDPEGGVNIHATGQEGAFIAPMGQDCCLIAGAPVSFWYTPSDDTLHQTDVKTTERPVVYEGRAYLIDTEDSCIALVDQANVTKTPFQKGSWLIGLAIASENTIFAAELTGANKDRGRVIHWAGESWTPVRAPFQGPVYDLAWEDNSLLAITKQGLYLYD
ncbi:MAG: hypothetical protein MI924_02030, partial [Chloroflexales bacterium]|nr:hypothetical protein [Chloroflexales bacterium]